MIIIEVTYKECFKPTTDNSAFVDNKLIKKDLYVNAMIRYLGTTIHEEK